MFTNYRVFQIVTNPGNFVVHRSRDDFKWLGEKLQEEYPTAQVVKIENSQLNKQILEDYFDYLLNSQNMHYSRSLKFFLCTDDLKFRARRDRDDSYMQGLFTKIFHGPQIKVDDLNICETKKTYVCLVWYRWCRRTMRITCIHISTSWPRTSSSAGPTSGSKFDITQSGGGLRIYHHSHRGTFNEISKTRQSL